jgi:hypothetical protein
MQRAMRMQSSLALTNGFSFTAPAQGSWRHAHALITPQALTASLRGSAPLDPMRTCVSTPALHPAQVGTTIACSTRSFALFGAVPAGLLVAASIHTQPGPWFRLSHNPKHSEMLGRPC